MRAETLAKSYGASVASRSLGRQLDASKVIALPQFGARKMGTRSCAEHAHVIERTRWGPGGFCRMNTGNRSMRVLLPLLVVTPLRYSQGPAMKPAMKTATKRSRPARSALPLLSSVLAGFLLTIAAEAQRSVEPRALQASEEKLQPGTPLDFRVIGLTEENSDEVRQNLTGMTTQVYVCGTCKHEERVSGRCRPCNLELEVTEEVVLLEAVPDVEGESIHLTPAATRNLRFSELAETLGESSVEIDTAHFPLPGKSHLVLRGGTVQTNAAIEKALVDSRFFELVQARFDPVTSETHVVVLARRTAPTYAEVSALLDQVGLGARLTEVIWGPLPTTVKVG